MPNRQWISTENMFWTDDEWMEAHKHAQSSSQNLAQLAGEEQIRLMIGYLMNQYPVSKEQLSDAKQKYAK